MGEMKPPKMWAVFYKADPDLTWSFHYTRQAAREHRDTFYWPHNWRIIPVLVTPIKPRRGRKNRG